MKKFFIRKITLVVVHFLIVKVCSKFDIDYSRFMKDLLRDVEASAEEIEKEKDRDIKDVPHEVVK